MGDPKRSTNSLSPLWATCKGPGLLIPIESTSIRMDTGDGNIPRPGSGCKAATVMACKVLREIYYYSPYD
jgi:hypothetical protein